MALYVRISMKSLQRLILRGDKYKERVDALKNLVRSLRDDTTTFHDCIRIKEDEKREIAGKLSALELEHRQQGIALRRSEQELAGREERIKELEMELSFKHKPAERTAAAETARADKAEMVLRDVATAYMAFKQDPAIRNKIFDLLRPWLPPAHHQSAPAAVDTQDAPKPPEPEK